MQIEQTSENLESSAEARAEFNHSAEEKVEKIKTVLGRIRDDLESAIADGHIRDDHSVRVVQTKVQDILSSVESNVADLRTVDNASWEALKGKVEQGLEDLVRSIMKLISQYPDE